MTNPPSLFSSLVFVLAINCRAVAQQDLHQQQQSRLPEGTVDGAVQPEAIPDLVAFRLFFAVLGEAPKSAIVSPSVVTSQPVMSPRQAAMLHPILLDDADQSTLIQELSRFKSDLLLSTSADTGSKNANTTARLSPEELTQRSLDTLRENMSPSGFERLEQFVRAEKRHMKVVPLPQMTDHSR